MRYTMIVAAAAVVVAIVLIVLALIEAADRPSHTRPDYPAGMAIQPL
ncbi:hypothetical protein [Nocardia sp. NPDC050406]